MFGAVADVIHEIRVVGRRTLPTQRTGFAVDGQRVGGADDLRDQAVFQRILLVCRKLRTKGFVQAVELPGSAQYVAGKFFAVNLGLPIPDVLRRIPSVFMDQKQFCAFIAHKVGEVFVVFNFVLDKKGAVRQFVDNQVGEPAFRTVEHTAQHRVFEPAQRGPARHIANIGVITR